MNILNKITFCINTARNEQPYLKLLLESLLNGVDVNFHDFMVFVDSDNQDTVGMLLAVKSEFPNLTIIRNDGPPVGYAGNINYMFSKARTDIVSYLQSDMVVCLDYDKKLLAHMADNQILCSTRCEPPLHTQYDNAITYVRDFGIVPDGFKYEDFLKFAEANKDPNKLTDYFFAPFTLYKNLWNDIGGHDVSFKKSREDSDIALRFALKNYAMKQTWEAIVYHFTCTSSRQWALPENRTKNINMENDKIELDRFIKKWGTFLHASSAKDVIHIIHHNPSAINQITVKNPPIDESKLTLL
jgi:GT2 family glycosyltransferase